MEGSEKTPPLHPPPKTPHPHFTPSPLPLFPRKRRKKKIKKKQMVGEWVGGCVGLEPGVKQLPTLVLW